VRGERGKGKGERGKGKGERGKGKGKKMMLESVEIVEGSEFYIVDVIDQVTTNISRSTYTFLAGCSGLTSEDSPGELLEEVRHGRHSEGIRRPMEWLVHFCREPGLEYGPIFKGRV
jgi:hypothetical protein